MGTATELGPIDYVVIELPGDTRTFTDSVCAEITELVNRGMIRVLDLLVIDRDRAGAISVTEFEELDSSRLPVLRDELAEILALEDVENLATAVIPGHAAAVIVWEYLVTRPLSAAAQTSGCRLVAQGRIPTQAIVATLNADQSATE
ncbi:DUF6325 family protein [Gordonia sp. CPCC 206044]|uniref:DUF6325 family protein n=1 Tax=Gordonia sp. CPCC 206044 TaxID=3140793 RepID=UPI003AF37DD7